MWSLPGGLSCECWGHPGIDTADLLIAATARALGVEIMTRNVRHFPMFPDLSAAY